MKNCLFVGGNGFLGSHLVEELVKIGCNVKVLDINNDNVEVSKQLLGDIEFINGNFLNIGDKDPVFKGIDTLFHYASLTNPVTAAQNPIYDIETNIVGSVKLFQAAVRSNVERIVYPSSGGTIYGDTDGQAIKEDSPTKPTNPYAISKLAIENYLSFICDNNIRFSILRYANPYGPKQNPRGAQGVIPIFLYRILQNKQPVIFGDGKSIRDYFYIKDAVEATIKVLESETNEIIFNIGSGVGVSLLELIDLISEVTGREVRPKFIEKNGTYISKIVLDINKIKHETGWFPTTAVIDGIYNTWEWLQDYVINE